jgi:hypothetical protein
MSRTSIADLYRDPLEDRPDPPPGWHQPRRVVDRARPPALLVAVFFLLIVSGFGLRFAPSCVRERVRQPVAEASEVVREQAARFAEHARAFERERGFFPSLRCGNLPVAYSCDCKPVELRAGNELVVNAVICRGHEKHAARIKTRWFEITLRPEAARE